MLSTDKARGVGSVDVASVNAPLSVIVLAPVSEQDREGESQSWTTLGAEHLARAYGDNEPGYSIADVKP